MSKIHKVLRVLPFAWHPAGSVKELNFGTTKDKMLVIEGCPNMKVRTGWHGEIGACSCDWQAHKGSAAPAMQMSDMCSHVVNSHNTSVQGGSQELSTCKQGDTLTRHWAVHPQMRVRIPVWMPSAAEQTSPAASLSKGKQGDKS